MQTKWIRRTTGLAGLLAVLGLTAGTAQTAAPEPLPDTSSTKMTEADIAYLKKGLDKDLKKESRAVPGLRAAAASIAIYGKPESRDTAVKIAELLSKKDFAEAKTLAAKLTPGGGAPTDLAPVLKSSKIGISEAMAPYKAEKYGGMNIELDLRKLLKKVSPADVKNVEVLAARTVVLTEFSHVLPTDKAAANATNQKKWESYNKGLLKASRETLAEAVKGEKADKSKLEKGLRTMDSTCTACHNDFRD